MTLRRTASQDAEIAVEPHRHSPLGVDCRMKAMVIALQHPGLLTISVPGVLMDQSWTEESHLVADPAASQCPLLPAEVLRGRVAAR